MKSTRMGSTQRGAALVVGLVLLLIITLLAISVMNTSVTELTAAGNEQFQENAFQAAETGIERSVAVGNFNPNAAVNDPVTTLPNGDTFQIQTLPRGSSPPPPGYSLGQFNAEHFEIQSTGSSTRNATANHTQGLFLVVPNPG